MDYIPLPLSPCGMPLAVPALSSFGYDGSTEFPEYPERQGWSARTPGEWDVVFTNPSNDFRALLQRWLLFAPLQAIGGRGFSLTQIISTNASTGEPEITLKQLVGILMSRLRLGGQLGGQPLLFDTYYHKIYAGASQINRVLSAPVLHRAPHQQPTKLYTLYDFALQRADSNPCDPAVSIATSCLMDFLRTFFLEHCARYAGQTMSYNLMLGHSNVHEWRSLIWTKLLQRGWCPSQLSATASHFNTAGHVFLSLIEPPGPARQHQLPQEMPWSSSGVGQQNGLCSTLGCAHRRLQDSTYKTAHAPNCLNCYIAEAPFKNICNILQGQSFPLIRPLLSSEPKPSSAAESYREQVQLVPWTEGTSYIAISHVWSDGLGNCQENSIPFCQFLRISEYVKAANAILNGGSKPPLFWLDTMCVPPDSICCPPGAREEQKAQNLAMEKMREVYSCSAATVVLDAWLFTTCKAGMSSAEKLMRILTCVWNSRLWTFQEGALPKVLLFQFQDGLEDIDKLRAELQREMEMDFALRYTLGQRIIASYNGLRGFQDSSLGTEDSVSNLFRSMAYRTTSVATDEALCLSTIMNTDMARILEVEKNQRISIFWQQICETKGKLPISILLSSVPTLDNEGLSWAPKSLLLNGERLSIDDTIYPIPNIQLPRSATLTSRGLQIECPGLLIESCGYSPDTVFYVQDDCRFLYIVKGMLFKDLSGEELQEAFAIPVIYGKAAHRCTDRNGELMPLLQMRPKEGEFMIGRKVGVAMFRCLIPRLDRDQYDFLNFATRNTDGLVRAGMPMEDTERLAIARGRDARPGIQYLGLARGRNVHLGTQKWCIE